MLKIGISIILVLLVVLQANAGPIWKVFCAGQPIFRGRMDPIVNVQKLGGHVHKVAGSANFSASLTTKSYVEYYNDAMASACTTCSIRKVDQSQYWHPDLYYQWPNGTFSLVPGGGLTVYYLSRAGNDGTQKTNPNFQPFPPGFRMLTGSPFRRSFDPNNNEHKAVSYVCLGSNPSGAPEINNFPTQKYFCSQGLRAQVFFPMCWNGKDLDVPDHKSHMAYPTNYNGGNCPSTHPVRVPGVFFEAIYNVDKFPHGDGTRQPFVWSCGDPTGYGFHGDFLNGWDPAVMAAALADPKCDNDNPDMAFGNNVKACPPLAQYVQETPAGACAMANPIPLTEDLGMSHTLPSLPGCNPITYGPETATPCSGGLGVSSASGKRYLIKSKLTKKYLSSNPPYGQLMSSTVTYPSLSEVWAYNPIAAGGNSLQCEQNGVFASSAGPNMELIANRGSPQGWESFVIVPQANGYSAITSGRNGNYICTKTDGTLAPTSKTVLDPDCLYTIEVPTGGAIRKEDLVTVSVLANAEAIDTPYYQSSDSTGHSPEHIIIGVSVGVIGLLVIVLVVVIFKRKGTNGKEESV